MRTVELTFDTEQDPNSQEVGKALRQMTTTTFEDDTGQCFGAAGGGTARQMISEFRQRDSLDRWRMSVIKGDYLQGSDYLLTYTNYEETGPRVGQHILGAWDYRFVESGAGGPESRYEERAAFDDSGNLTETWVQNEWATASTQLGADPSSDVVTPAGDMSQDSDVLHLTYTHYDSGNVNTSTVDGADPPPSGNTSPSSFTTTFTWQRGVVKKIEQSGMAAPVSEYLLDDSGLVKDALDSNGRKTTFSYDVLGRVTRVDPEDAPSAPEQASRLYYPDFTDPNGELIFKAITSGGEEGEFLPGSSDQLYSEQTSDGLGRTIERRRALPDSTQAVQVARYDQLGRVIFSSVWMSESDYAAAAKTSWEAPDRDGDGNPEYRVTGVPLTPGDPESRPWGVIAFYGTPSGSDPYNPLAIEPDGLGRVRRTIAADGTTVDLDYCGPHSQKTVQVRGDVGSDQTQPAVTRYYRDGLGRLVLVDTPDSSEPGGQAADAIYAYDLRGNLKEAKIVDDLGDDPFSKWLDGSLNPGTVQLRTFDYDAAGRLEAYETPEEGRVEVLSYNAAGQPWRWQDASGAERGYVFEARYDGAGRQEEIHKVLLPDGAPSASLEEGFEFAAGTYGSWTPGTIDESGVFQQQSSSSWQVVTYADLQCIDPPPGGTGTNGLYLGDNCNYDNVPCGTQAVRQRIPNVERDTVLTFAFWRQVRKGVSDYDRFEVLLAAADANQLANAPRALRLDARQKSYARWRKTIMVRPADFFDDSDPWPRDLDLVFAFTKGDGQAGVGTGIFVDNVFVGRRGTETLVRYSYSETHCDSGTVDASCADAVMNADQAKDQLTTVESFHDGRVLAITRYVYRGLNGRLSMREQWIDWTMTANPADPSGWARWITRYSYTDQGQLAEVAGPYLAGDPAPRTYSYDYLRGHLDGIRETSEGIDFVKPSAGSALYGPWSNLEFLRFANGSSSTFSTDVLGRVSEIDVKGPDEATYWNSGAYRFDGAGNIVGIGDQEYSYFPSGSLHQAKVRPQAGDPDAALNTLTYNYDIFGNMTSRQLDPADPKPDVPGLEFSGRSYDLGDHVTNAEFRYDLMGRMIRFPREVDTGGSAPVVQAAMWSDGGQLVSFFQGEPTTGEAPAEQYLYNAGGLRLVRLPLGRDGQARISVRDAGGQTVAEYVDKPGGEGLVLEKEFVHGFGRLLVERHPAGSTPAQAAGSSLYSDGSYGLDLTDDEGGTTFDVDIQTSSGFRNQVAGVQPDGSGHYQISESDLAPGETNYLRIKSVAPEESPYSVPVSISYDPAIDGSSENQVRAVSVSRIGDNLLVRWSLHQDNGKAFQVYFHRSDNGLTYALSATALPAGTTEYTVANQALAAPCGGIFLRQGDIGSGGGLTNPTPPSPEAGLPGPFYGELEPGFDGCLGGSDPPEPQKLVDRYHFCDHLGSLRVETGEGGWFDLGIDYYPFGLEMESTTSGGTSASRWKYTGHERDDETGQDYMKARYKSLQLADFMLPDPFLGSISPGDPVTWKRNAYVLNSPLQYVDPSGLNSESTLCIDTNNDGEKDTCLEGGGGWTCWSEGAFDYCVSGTSLPGPSVPSVGQQYAVFMAQHFIYRLSQAVFFSPHLAMLDGGTGGGGRSPAPGREGHGTGGGPHGLPPRNVLHDIGSVLDTTAAVFQATRAVAVISGTIAVGIGAAVVDGPSPLGDVVGVPVGYAATVAATEPLGWTASAADIFGTAFTIWGDSRLPTRQRVRWRSSVAYSAVGLIWKEPISGAAMGIYGAVVSWDRAPANPMELWKSH
ncbi:MAG: RHS repeat-associated core domain-containing protein [Acidobacteriota bacterium]|nr:RHS repeat-associated core domain-containing protein [Acidobacteriota bacterium]